MEISSAVFSIAFFFVCSIGGCFGIYILYINVKADLNRAFFLCCTALSVWAFGFSISISASTLEVSEFWRRFAAIGWGTLFSLLLHFIIILTGRSNRIKKGWLFVLLYLPVAVNMLAFVVPSEVNSVPFNLIQSHHGWINVAENNAWDIYYMIYYISFMVAGLVLVWDWLRKSQEKHIRKQAVTILGSFIVALVLGTLTDMLFNTVLSLELPQIAPVVMMIPITAIYFLMKRYGLMNPKQIDHNEIILNEAAHEKIYRYLSIAFIAGALLNIFSMYLLYENGDLINNLYFSGAIALIGITIQVVNRLKIASRRKDHINIATASLAIPAITLRFIDFASVTVWAFPFILIIVALVFNKRMILLIFGFSTLLTQVLVWVFAPQIKVSIDSVDFATRIGLFVICFALAFYVNKVYIARLKENAAQIRFQTLISEVSSDFVSANQHNMQEKIDAMLEKIGNFFDIDRVYSCLVDKEVSVFDITHEWHREGVTSIMRELGTISARKNRWWSGRVLANEVVYLADLQNSKMDEAADTKKLVRSQTQSTVSIPIFGNGKVLGYLGLDSVFALKKWHENQLKLLKVLTNTLADAMLKAEAEKEINFMAFYDQLTKLPNRILFNDRLNQAVLTASRTDKKIGIIFLDLDAFKNINDTLGHESGDELLRDIALKLTKILRCSDTVSRFGGDEFLIMVNSMSEAGDIVKVADHIMEMFREPFILKEQEFFITASAGISVYPYDGDCAEKLIKNADIAMYQAKELGKNQYVLCSHEMKEAVLNETSLTTSLYRALGRDEFVVHYQPQVCMKTKRIIGLEALVRWNHPTLGLVSPGRFIPLAEKTGLIGPIGEWVLSTACRQNVQWQMMGLPPVLMAVNLSVNQLRNPKLADTVSGILYETGLKPEYLELEITESAATKEPDYIFTVLNKLKALGIALSIDDFGTEYSSLSRLKMLPVDRIKMDMQFVHGIEGSDKDKAIAMVIINLAKNLGLKVIAEGVETEPQNAFLHQKMCDEVQGFYYYRPMPAPQVETALRQSAQTAQTSAQTVPEEGAYTCAAMLEMAAAGEID